jgi:folate-binding protein YgfZ
MSSDPREETRAARDGTVVADLSHNALIEVTGDDATEFLHAQFTNDVQALAAGGAQWNGWCSAKGRLLATFLLVKRAQGYLMLLPAEIAAPIAKRLGMFVLRSKVKIADASGSLERIGVAGTQAREQVAAVLGDAPAPLRAIERDGAIGVALDATRFVLFAPDARAQQIWLALSRSATPAGADAWEWTSIRAGMPTVVAATQEAFVPQMANFDLIGAVSFQKGCYPGQEIVARTHYRGGLKRRMAIAHFAPDAHPAPGESLFSPAFGDQAAGVVANAAPSPEGGFDALVVAQIESLEGDDLRWKSPEGPRIRIVSRPNVPAS